MAEYRNHDEAFPYEPWLGPETAPNHGADDSRALENSQDIDAAVDTIAHATLGELELDKTRPYWSFHDVERVARRAARNAIEHMTVASTEGEK